MIIRSLVALTLAFAFVASTSWASQHGVDDPDLQPEQELGQEYEAEPGVPGAPIDPLPEVEPAPLPELDTDADEPGAVAPDTDLNDVGQTVVEAAETSPELGRFTQAFRDAAVVQDMTVGPYTIFAPSDEAFEQAALERGVTVDEFLGSDELREGFGVHVVEGRWTLEDVIAEVEAAGGMPVTLQTLNGETLTVTLVGETLMINDIAVVTSPDLDADDHVIHTVDTLVIAQQL
jgi:uncharacterized surface protein with fasciclin (FAS1) repeats